MNNDILPLIEYLPDNLEYMQDIFSPTTVLIESIRSTQELALRSLAFSQFQLCSPSDFIKEASKRRIQIDTALLEDLHRTSLLVPFFRILNHDPKGYASTKTAHHVSEEAHPIGLSRTMFYYHKAGRLFDPAREDFVAWHRTNVQDVRPSEVSSSSEYQYLYSQYQLLALEVLKDVIGGSVKAVRDPRKGSGLRLNPEMLMTSSATGTMRAWRSLAVVLHAIDSRYRPLVVRTVVNPTDWPHFAKNFDAKAELAWLGVGKDEVRNAASTLRSCAESLEVTGDFSELLRMALPDKWTSLRGEALKSFDFRIAAELLDMFIDHIEKRPILDVVRSRSHSKTDTTNERLLARPRSLDNLLTDLGLSPHPSLVIGVEGETEELVVSKVFELLGYNLDPTWIRIERFGGVGKDLTLLAKYATRPFLGASYGDFVVLARPLTRFLILVDAENNRPRNYITFQDREKQRKLLVEEILKDTEKRFHKDLKSADAKLVTIRTWNKYPFEFAHFSNRELAKGLTSLAGCDPTGGHAHLVERIANERKQHRPKNGASSDIERVWHDCFSDRRFSKISFAQEMWPVLESKIADSLDGLDSSPPVLKNIQTALQLASLSRGPLLVQSNTG